MSRAIAIAITILLGMWVAIQGIEAGNPGALGLDQRAFLWIGIIAAGLGTAQGFLPRVQGPLEEPTIGEDDDDESP